MTVAQADRGENSVISSHRFMLSSNDILSARRKPYRSVKKIPLQESSPSDVHHFVPDDPVLSDFTLQMKLHQMTE